MKKSLVLAMAMALGVTASAYAANPFSDVPAGHWAYDSISKLAAAGVIEGYGDDTFRGDRLMTRYEMAQIVAKAMAKGANVDKLAAEFADELDALGVRVAALEKKSDNVKIAGQIRYRWVVGSPVAGGNVRQRTHALRSRLTFNGTINDNWAYVGQIHNNQDFTTDNGDDNMRMQQAYVTGRIGGAKIMAGRITTDLIGGDSDVYSDRVDKIQASYGEKFNIAGWYGKPTEANGAVGPYSVFGGARLAYNWDKVGVYAEYDKFGGKHRANGQSRDIFGIGADAAFGDLGVNLLYLHGKWKNSPTAADDKKSGFTIGLTYKGADKSKVGTWGVGAKYYDQGNLTYFQGLHGFDAFGNMTQNSGFKGFRLTADYTVAKNMVASVMYYDLKGKGPRSTKEKTVVTQMMFTF